MTVVIKIGIIKTTFITIGNPKIKGSLILNRFGTNDNLHNDFNLGLFANNNTENNKALYIICVANMDLNDPANTAPGTPLAAIAAAFAAKFVA